MKTNNLLATSVATMLLVSLSAGAVDRADVTARVAGIPKDHPRLFLPKGAEVVLKQRIAADPTLRQFHRAVLAEADRQLTTKPVEHVLIGRRLLDKSRTCLSRLTHLSYAWRMTGEPKYLERAKAEMLAVGGFTDWNPSHFLDVAEMTTGMAIGYDWLYEGLDATSRATIRTAIIEKGLKASFEGKQWWINGNNNWNQVCHAGMTVGALAVHETADDMTAEIVARAVEGVPHSMMELAPDGAYPEGPGYWVYGTSFNVLLISALESVLGTDFNLCASKGFLSTADYYLHATGPTGMYFNYADCGAGSNSIQPAMFWLAGRRKEPYLLWNELGWLSKQIKEAGDKPIRSNDRLFPLILAWSIDLPSERTPPKALSWTGMGPMPVAMHRSSWQPDATFVGVKGGSPSGNHAHMDVGTFVMDADGVRWAEDLGMQDYNSLESKGVDLWNNKQDSQRWKVFRLGSSAHNIITVDGKQQVLQGKAAIITAKEGRTVVDTSGVYQGQLRNSQRGVALQDDRSVIVQDELVADKEVTVRWAMVTRAEVAITGPGYATLTQKNKRLTLRVVEPAGAELKTWPTDPPPAEIDAPNPGTRLIGFEVKIPAGTPTRLVVELVPDGVQAKVAVKPLAEW